MFWEVFLSCPKCGTRHLLLEIGFNPQGDVDLSARCCGTTIGHRMTWEEAVAGAIRQEERFLAQTADGRKQLEKTWQREN